MRAMFPEPCKVEASAPIPHNGQFRQIAMQRLSLSCRAFRHSQLSEKYGEICHGHL